MIKNLYKKYEEIIKYLIFGVLTTVVSLVTYYILVYTILDPNKPLELQIANIISWITCVTFAYITNRKYVFKSTNPEVMKEFIAFASGRISTGVMDIVIMFVTVNLFSMDYWIAKIFISSVLVMIANYLLSKLFVFKKK